MRASSSALPAPPLGRSLPSRRGPRGSGLRLAALVLAARALPACGGAAPSTEPPPTLALEIGAGNADGSPGFVVVADHADLQLEPGAQGGFHVFINVRVPASIMNATGLVYLDRQARRVSTGELASQARQRARFAPVPGDPSWFETEEPFRMFMCPTPVGVPVRDEELVLRVRAFDEAADVDARAEGELHFTPRCPSGDQAAFCARICAG